MKTAEEGIKEIISRIQGRSDVVGHIDETTLHAFIHSEVGEDPIVSYLFFKTAFDESTIGLMVYICTNTRLVRLQVSTKGLEHSGTVLSEITDITKRSISGEYGPMFDVGVRVQGKEVLTLKYQEGNTQSQIENFFERIKDGVVIRKLSAA